MAAARSSPLLIKTTHCNEDVTVTVAGVLDSSTYREVRDAVIKAALEIPRAVHVIVDDLQVPKSSAWAVFTSARWHVHEWPDVPISLVCRDAAARRTMDRVSIGRYVPIYQTLAAARTAVDSNHIAYRRRSARVLTADRAGVRTGHRFIEAVLASWLMAERAPVAAMIGHAFMENAVAHSECPEFKMRLETDGTDVVVAVSDGAATPAVRLERTASDLAPRGLDVVAVLSSRWGCSPTAAGKTVWAVVRPGDDMSSLGTLF